MKTAALRVGIWIKKCQDAIPPVRHVENQEIKRQNRGRERISKITQTDSGDEQNASSDSGAGDRGPQIGLEHNETQKYGRGRGGRQQRVAPVVHRLRLIFEKPREEEN